MLSNEEGINENCHGVFTMLLLNNTAELFLLFLNMYLLGTVKSHFLLLWLEITLIIRFLLFVSCFTKGGITLKCGILKQNYACSEFSL